MALAVFITGVSGMIAIDIDDCIAGYVSACIERYGYPVVWSHSLREMWPLVDWDAHFDPLSHNAFIIGLRPLQGAKEGCGLLAYGHHLLYLTASTEASASVRKLWLKIHDFPQAPMICTSGFENKAQWLRDNAAEVNVLIEDLPLVLEAAHDAGIYTIVMDCPWNRSVRSGKRVRTWKEVAQLFKMPQMP